MQVMTPIVSMNDAQITAMLKADWTKPIQFAANCIDYRNSHPTKKEKQIMKDNGAYMRNKTETARYDPNAKKKKHGKGHGHASSFNEVQKRDLWNARDKAFHGQSFETVRNSKPEIVDKDEYEYMTNPKKNEQVGYKPTKKLSKDNRAEINRKISIQKGTAKQETTIEHGLCIGKTSDKYVCPKIECKGTFTETYCCMWCELPERYLTPVTGLAFTQLKQKGKHELK